MNKFKTYDYVSMIVAVAVFYLVAWMAGVALQGGPGEIKGELQTTAFAVVLGDALAITLMKIRIWLAGRSIIADYEDEDEDEAVDVEV